MLSFGGPGHAGLPNFSTRFLLLPLPRLALSPVLRRSGWPLNQGSTGPLLLVQLYASHFRHLDFFPVWSSSDAFGMGSPVLLYYHRTFFYVAGLLMAFGGLSLKASVVTTIGLFLVVGAYGMRRALRVVTDDRLLYTVGSLGFLFTNYVFTDWLYPRGDLAEFSAVMLVPWLLWWCLVFVKDQRFSYLLIPIVVILVNTHSAIALTALFALAVALVTFLLGAGSAGLRAVLSRMAISFCAITVLLAPLLFVEVRLGRYYDPQTKNTGHGYAVSQQFANFGAYFVDTGHRWFPQISHNFVQIDYALWVPIALVVTGCLVHWARTRRSPTWWSAAATNTGLGPRVPRRESRRLPVPAVAALPLRLPDDSAIAGDKFPVANARLYNANCPHTGGCTRRQAPASLPPACRLGSGGRRLAGVAHSPLAHSLGRTGQLRFLRRPGFVPVDEGLHRTEGVGPPALQWLLPRSFDRRDLPCLLSEGLAG